jgi:hypothetical protein
MIHPLHLDEARYPLKVRWFLLGAWVLILAKCAAVAWVIDRWHVPFNAGWVIIPTLVFAALATVLWFGVQDD